MKKVLSFLLSLLLIVTVIPLGALSAAAQGTDAFAPLTREDYYGRSLLSKTEQTAYDLIADCIENARASVSIKDCKLSEGSFLKVLTYYRYDHPQHFWLDNNYQYSLIQQGKQIYITTVYPSYLLEGAALTQARAAFDETVDWVVGLVSGMSSDYERALFLHDWLCDNVSYVIGATNAHNAYGALIDGQAVCEGYAEAYQYLLYKAGIQCLEACGTSRNEAHGWNVVCIGGFYYHVDVTWDDQSPNVFHAYFNLTDDAIREDHSFASVFPSSGEFDTSVSYNYPLPACSSTAANYAVKQGVCVVAPYDAGAIGAALRRGGGTAHLFIQDDVAGFKTWLNTKTNTDAVAYAYGIRDTYRYEYRVLGREIILSFIADGLAPGSDPQPDANGFLIVDGVLKSYSGRGGSVTIPSTVTRIGDSAFSGCTALTGVTIPVSVTEIGSWAFAGCTGLTSVTLPSQLTKLGSHAFYACSALTGVTLPASLKTIGDDAFGLCTALTGVALPAGVTAFGSNVFYKCLSLTVSAACTSAAVGTLREEGAGLTLAHAFGAWTQTATPDCIHEGAETRACSLCGESENRAIQPTGVHTFGDWTQTKAPNCTEPGEETSTCTVCRKSETRTVDPLGHTFGDWTQTKAPSCTEPGEETHTCTVCTATETRAVDPLGHSFTNYTDNGDGTHTAVCDRCDATETIGGELFIADFDGDGFITDDDAIWLLMYTFFPEDYPVGNEAACDFDGDGFITDDDAIWLLMYTFFPEDYPIV